MDLFVRESGSTESPDVVLLHGGHMSGWSLTPVVERLPQYHCLVPDLPLYGRSGGHGPFDIRRAADAIARIISSRSSSGHAHLVGYSLGAQVAAQLLAAKPGLVDRAVLCGPIVNTMPAVRFTQRLLGALARNTWLAWTAKRGWNASRVRMPEDNVDDYRADTRAIGSTELAGIVMACVGFTIPEGLEGTQVPTLLIAGENETPLARHWTAALADPLPNAVRKVATGMGHDWPLEHPDLFANTVDCWLSNRPLPPQIA